MLNIFVDGEKVARFNVHDDIFIKIGSGLHADVRLAWAAPTSLSIHRGNAHARFVVVHDEDGMTHSGGHRLYDNGQVYVRTGEPMIIRGHVIMFDEDNDSDVDELAESLEMCDMKA